LRLWRGCQDITYAAFNKARTGSVGIVRGLNPPPPSGLSFSATAKALIDVLALGARLELRLVKTFAAGIQPGAKALTDIAALRHD
jgi:hypothetical protein